MALQSSRLCVAFDAGSVCVARVTSSLGRARVEGAAHALLPPGTLRPHPSEANVVDGASLQRALSETLQALGDKPRSGTPVRLLLPDGLARPIVVEPPRDVDAEEFARFRLLPGLPYAGSEASVGLLALAGRRVLASALRRAVVTEYERAAREAGLVPESVFLAPLAALSALMRAGVAPGVALIVGDAALSMAAFGADGVRAYRTRLRDPGLGEAARVLAEAERTSMLGGADGAGRLTIVGRGARLLREALQAAGHAADMGRIAPAGAPEDAADWAWLGAAA